jgi:hypothetical protein
MSGNVIPLRASAATADADKPWREVTEPAPPPPEHGGGDGPPPAPPPPEDEAPDFGPVTPLGLTTRRERTACVFLDASGRRVVLDATAMHKRASLDLLFGGAAAHPFLAQHWPLIEQRRGKPVETGDWNPEGVGSALMSACLAVGDADAVRLRLDGVWPLTDGLLFHAGDAVLTYRGGVEERHRTGLREGRAIYIATGARRKPAERPATVEQVQAFAQRLRLWRYAEPEAAPKLLLGLLHAGLVAAALPWRPHVIIRGVTNAGKSSLVTLLAAAAGADAPPKSLTPAGLQRMYDSRSGLIALDEQEAQAEHVQRIIAIMRGASDGEGNLQVQVGEGGGKVAFRVAGVFLLGAISPPALTDADESRITLVHLLRPEKDRRAEIEAAQAEAAALHPALLRRAIAAWPRYQAAWRVARDAAGARDATSRSADQLGALVAGWWVMAHDGPLDPPEADEEMGRLLPFLTTRTAAAEADTGMLVLQHLLASRVPLKERSSDQITVMAALNKAFRAQHRVLHGGAVAELAEDWRCDLESWRHQLGSCGLMLNAFGQSGRGWPWPCEGPPRPGLLIADGHPMLEHLFRGTPWQGKAWLGPLLDLPGALKGKAASFPSGGTHKTRFVPLAALGLDEEALMPGSE